MAISIRGFFSEYSFHAPMDYFLKPGKSIFSRPCKCQSDWKDHFCKKSASLPSICICRQFSDAGGSCQQFMTQCYCCFNQPGLYCNQLQCSKGQPEFGPKSNTTCVCHLPAFYPYHICTQEDLLGAIDTDNSVLLDWVCLLHFLSVNELAVHATKTPITFGQIIVAPFENALISYNGVL
ncbi:unnamed protein product [Toxocara canis]|uniref:EGF-like domain-containing protein n=1 Tax=Toxocara canis TaxID=6265 RepID=A0A183U1J4_TOXCA|nr:unnamed protein product [Toxocara canis]